jgi:hypothetical protein
MGTTATRTRQNRTSTVDFHDEATYMGFQEHLPENVRLGGAD